MTKASPDFELIKKELAIRARAKDDFLLFTKYTFPGFDINWHHRKEARILEDFANGLIKNLILCAPPQTGKSEMTSRRLPPFALGKNPDKKIALAAYSPTHASDFNLDVQRIITDVSYRNIFPDTTISDRNNSKKAEGTYLRNKNKFEVIGRRGSLKSVGVGTPLTGSTVDMGIIDDPIKDHVEAFSSTYRERVWNWYDTVFTTRLHNNSQQLITQTRWHEDDLVGRILKKQPNDWLVVNFPAINEVGPSEYDPRNIGEVLWEEKHSLERMLAKQKESAFTFSSLYQQHPTPLEGNIVGRKHFKIIDFSDLPKEALLSPVHFFFDGAYTSKTSNDPSGLLCGFKYKNDVYLLDFWRDWLEFNPVFNKITDTVNLYGDQRSQLIIEIKAIGETLMQEIKRLSNGLVNVRSYSPKGGKEDRLRAYAPKIENGNVYLIRGPWNGPFIESVCGFPALPHDEEVDTLTMCLDYFFNINYKPPRRWKTGRMS